MTEPATGSGAAHNAWVSTGPTIPFDAPRPSPVDDAKAAVEAARRAVEKGRAQAEAAREALVQARADLAAVEVEQAEAEQAKRDFLMRAARAELGS